jgi:hypothetical protein
MFVRYQSHHISTFQFYQEDVVQKVDDPDSFAVVLVRLNPPVNSP